MKKSAIIIGASGLTGGYLLELLLNDERYNQVILFTRKSIGKQHPKLTEHLVDMQHLETCKEQFKADDVFCCIGTTKKKTPDKEVYRSIDYGIPVQLAELSEELGVNSLIVMSAMGASSKSSTFYSRLKGEMEEKVATHTIPKIHFVRPALISGTREEWRLGEYVMKQFFKVLDYLLVGPLEKYRSIHPEKIARTMIWLANNEYTRVVVENDVIHEKGNV